MNLKKQFFKVQRVLTVEPRTSQHGRKNCVFTVMINKSQFDLKYKIQETMLALAYNMKNVYNLTCRNLF